MSPAIAFPLAALVGFVTAAPIGPVNLLCARRTLRHGFWPGFSAGLGAATAEAIYAALAVGGLSLASDLVSAHARPFRVFAGLALLAFSAFCWHTADADRDRRSAPEGIAGPRPRVAAGAIGTFALTLLNPLPLASMGVGLAASHTVISGRASALLEFLGLVAGSLLWWTTLTTTLARTSHRLGPQALRRLNHFVALALAAFGLIALSGLLV